MVYYSWNNYKKFLVDFLENYFKTPEKNLKIQVFFFLYVKVLRKKNQIPYDT